MENSAEKTPNPTALKRVAFFSFTSCEGCQLVVLNYGESFPDILKHLKIVNFRELMDAACDDYDIAFVEGSVSTKAELKKIRKIRERAETVISLGACAAIGGINCIKDIKEPISLEKARKLVYGTDAAKHRLLKDTVPPRPLDAVIKIDHYLHGCPISEEELLATLSNLMIGRRPTVPNHPVCTDCKMAGNVCVFEKGQPCNGPITRGGCRAVCVTYGAICWGCRGYVSVPNIKAHTETLINHGMSADEASASLALYGSYGKDVNA